MVFRGKENCVYLADALKYGDYPLEVANMKDWQDQSNMSEMAIAFVNVVAACTAKT